MARSLIAEVNGGASVDEVGLDAIEVSVDIDNLAAGAAVTPATDELIVAQSGTAKAVTALALLDAGPFGIHFGDGSDGDLVTSGNVSLLSDKYYDNLTVSNGDTISTNGFKIFAKSSFTLEPNAIVEYNGANGNTGETASGEDGAGGAEGGAANLTSGKTLSGNLHGGAGADGGTINFNGEDSDPGEILANGFTESTAGSAGGDGGAGQSGGNGGVGDAGGVVTITHPSGIRSLAMLESWRFWGGTTPYQIQKSAGSSGGGGGGGGNVGGFAGGGGGGGAGATGGSVFICARHIVNAGQIQANGGDGGDGGAGENDGSNIGGGGGGGAGGGGGIVAVIYQTLTGAGSIEADGGAAGAGGGVATAGDPGAAGTAGLTIILQGR